LELARGRAPALPEIPHAYRPRVEHLRDRHAYERLLGQAPGERPTVAEVLEKLANVGGVA
jgi:hypothetical protein